MTGQLVDNSPLFRVDKCCFNCHSSSQKDCSHHQSGVQTVGRKMFR